MSIQIVESHRAVRCTGDLEQRMMYFLECQLATVDEMASRKRRKKFEFKRHIDIAQMMIDTANEFGLKVLSGSTRVCEVVKNHNNSVEEWANSYIR